jgi:hypothetical protein
MDDHADIGVAVDRVDEQRRVFEQKFVGRGDGGIRIGLVAEHSDGDLVVARCIRGERHGGPRRREQRGRDQKSFHNPLFAKPWVGTAPAVLEGAYVSSITLLWQERAPSPRRNRRGPKKPRRR